MKAIIEFKKIDFYGTGRKINKPTISVELRGLEEGKPVLSICGNVWNSKNTDIVCGGQCLDEMLPYLKNNDFFKKIYRVWKLYHLNDMHAGSPRQEIALEEAHITDYKKAVEYLNSINLLDDDGYIYGTGWKYEAIPEEDLKTILELINNK